jgi:hypothetical protein
MENSKIDMISIPLTIGDKFNDENWTIAGVPLGDGNFWMYEDPNAVISTSDNVFRISITEFSKSNNQVQIFDNPKHLYLTKNNYKPGETGQVGFSSEMKSVINGGNPDDYRDGFGSFNVLDFATGMVFDIITNGQKTWVIYERLSMPGVTTEDEAFTDVIEITDFPNSGEFLNCKIIYNKQNDFAEFYCNDKMVYRAENIPVKIESLLTGFGFITLHPIENGQSVSCRGQGGDGAWGNFKYFAI